MTPRQTKAILDRIYKAWGENWAELNRFFHFKSESGAQRLHKTGRAIGPTRRLLELLRLYGENAPRLWDRGVAGRIRPMLKDGKKPEDEMGMTDGFVRVWCDECEYEEEYDMNALARGSYDTSNVEKEMKANGWTIDGSTYLCEMCAEEMTATKDGEKPEDGDG